MAKDPSQDFKICYSSFNTARFFYTTRPDVISQKKVVDLYSDLLDQKNFADFPIEELRKWKNWTLTDRILSFWKKNSHKHPIIQRSIVRYALQCPLPQAAKFIAAARKTDAEVVAEIEEDLRFEAQIFADANPGKP